MKKFEAWFQTNCATVGYVLAGLTMACGLVDLAMGHSVMAVAWMVLAILLLDHATSH